MKKISTLLTLSAAMLIPMTMSAADVKGAAVVNKGEVKVRTISNPQASALAPAKVTKSIKPKADVPEGYASVTLTAGDIWGDGSGYQMLLDADHNTYGSIIPETGGLTSSGDASAEVYAEFEYKIPENADGALATENIVINSSVTIQIPAGIYDYCITNPTAGDRMWIASSGGNVGGREDDFEFKSGVSYEFTVTLVGNNDGVILTDDDPAHPTVPENLEAAVDGTNVALSWVETNEATQWNLRYRKYVPEDKRAFFCDFENTDQLDGWMIYDVDGDGNSWGYASSEQTVAHSGQSVLTSASWNNTAGALTPDNILLSPVVKLNGTLSFWYVGQDPKYPSEVFQVYVLPKESIEDLEDLVSISDDITATGDYQEFTYNLSEQDFGAEEGRICIRHYNCTDWFRLNIDDFSVAAEGAIPEYEWINLEGVTANPYTLEDLEANTEYEAQVASVKGEEVSEWTKSTNFMTGESGVEGIKADAKADNVWYNLLGVRLNGKPSQAGIYINNGKKIFIK